MVADDLVAHDAAAGTLAGDTLAGDMLAEATAADNEMRARPEVPVVGRIQVPFRAEGAGVDVLSWGQEDLWQVMRRRRVWIPLAAVEPLPPGITEAQVADRLRFMLCRYQTLRTRLRLDPDRARQVVATEGEVPLVIGEADPDADPRAAAERLCLQDMDRDYDFAREWPIRQAVLRHRGRPTHLSTVLCHLALDGAGAALLTEDLSTWDPVTGRSAGPPPTLPPLEQAWRQRQPPARRQSAAALRHWADLLRAAPAHRLGDLGTGRRPRFWKGRLRSPAAKLGIDLISARTRADSAAVLLGLYAVVLARMTGVHPVLVQAMVSNRFRPGFAGTVSPVFQPGLCLVEVAGLTVDEVVAEVQRRTLATYKHAYYDPRDREELVARICRERGEEIELGVHINDRRPRAGEPAPAGAAVPPAAVRDALRFRRFDWVMAEETAFTDPVYLFVDEAEPAGEDPAALLLTVSADARCLAPERLRALLDGIEDLAVTAAADPATQAR